MKKEVIDEFKQVNESVIERERLTSRIRISTYVIFMIVSFVMTVLNILTNKGLLTIFTAVFSAFCLINTLVAKYKEKYTRIIAIMFSLQLYVMFVFFIISGNPDGFSILWTCLVPLLGMSFYERKKGTVISAIMLVTLIFLLWTPIGQRLVMYNYTMTFRTRYPILFCVSFFCAYIFHLISDNTYNRMAELEEKYKRLSTHDTLTGILNRQGMYNEFESTFKPADNIGVLMIDIDKFKLLNDTCGHVFGDLILTKTSEILQKSFNDIVCRWGGEEFVVIYKGGTISQDMLEQFRLEFPKVNIPELTDKGLMLSVSIGVYEGKLNTLDDLDSIINLADDAMYKAKTTGRNKIVYYNEM